MINFIGIGAQKSGTSWVYACLYEHPEICCPVKEIHFFSRPRYEEGIGWYEDHFRRCGQGEQTGEFSTSYLYSGVAAARIKKHYPAVKLIAILREPVARAYSQHRNAQKSGEITKTTSFADYAAAEPSVLEQGLYAKQLNRYLKEFDRSQLLLLIYEDSHKDPQRFIQSIYRHLGVDDTFVPPSLHTAVNIARTPKLVFVDRVMHHVAEALRRVGLDQLVHRVKTSGLTDTIRASNTATDSASAQFDRRLYASHFHDDTQALSGILGRDLNQEWQI